MSPDLGFRRCKFVQQFRRIRSREGRLRLDAVDVDVSSVRYKTSLARFHGDGTTEFQSEGAGYLHRLAAAVELTYDR